ANGSLFSLTSRTIRPRWRSCSVTEALDSASSSPAEAVPAISMARKANVVAPAIVPLGSGGVGRRGRGHRLGHPPRFLGGATARIDRGDRCMRGLPAEQSFQLLRHRGALLGERAGYPPGAHQARQVGVHRLHADSAGGLHGGVDLMCLALADQIAN